MIIMILVSKSMATMLKKPLVIIYWALIIGALYFVFSNAYEIVASFIYGTIERCRISGCS